LGNKYFYLYLFLQQQARILSGIMTGRFPASYKFRIYKNLAVYFERKKENFTAKDKVVPVRN
jgi:hypothetical protein